MKAGLTGAILSEKPNVKVWSVRSGVASGQGHWPASAHVAHAAREWRE